MKELSEEFGEIVIVYVNVEKWSGLVEGFRILNVLMFVYFKDGKEVVWQNFIRGKGEVFIKFEEFWEFQCFLGLYLWDFDWEDVEWFFGNVY